MSKVFYIYKDNEFYSSHGPISAHLVYEAFTANRLGSDFRIGGFNPDNIVREGSSKIINITEFNCVSPYRVDFSGASIIDNFMIVYPDQEFMNSDGKRVKVNDLKPNQIMLSLNGAIQIESVSMLDDSDIYTFYAIEVDDSMFSLFVNNIILFPFENVLIPNKERGEKGDFFF